MIGIEGPGASEGLAWITKAWLTMPPSSRSRITSTPSMGLSAASTKSPRLSRKTIPPGSTVVSCGAAMVDDAHEPGKNQTSPTRSPAARGRPR